MRVFKYRLFEKWAKKQGIIDDDLKKAVFEIENGLCDANLGGHVYKKRISRSDEGKRGALTGSCIL
ncbi:type II toxin-antitoxin system RelE/ParE family toxin [Methylovulum psychrotolerans]|uniref:Type II toxin-antitoxin system RelE/ParE family toxin n=1 Tax=Methylovulum psychrotolerans TaxID=1704499 RepID=A0A2S5CKE3_9GAMM|nr:type II toxin-antitoxin system RelE/ParE family toxin [Methylovulum psychrotolerans]POZ51289.1 type II toxin-antitoxin system RelE/ParE family toxin [Methylovulum psychrotolerans]